MIRLAEIYLSDELADKLAEKTKQYNEQHPEETITCQKSAEMFLEYGLRYLDISAIE